MVFTNDRRPSDRDVEALRKAGIFALLVPDEIYPVASQLHGLLIKTHVQDRSKIEVIKQVVAEHFDVDALLERLDNTVAPSGAPLAAADEALAETSRPRALVRKGLLRIADRASKLGGISRGPQDPR